VKRPITGELPPVLDRCRDSIEKLQRSARSFTGILGASNPFVAQRCYFKIPRDRPSITAEADDIRLATEATATVKGARPLKILSVLPEHNLLLTDPVESRETVFNLLSGSRNWWTRHRWGQAEMEAAGRALGSWLRAYHGGTVQSCEPQPEMVDRLSQICVGRLGVIKRSTQGVVDARLEDRVRALAAEYKDLCRSERVSVSRIHGDLNLSNVLVERETGDLVVIDFGDARDGMSLEDFVTVLHTSVTLLGQGHERDADKIPFARGLAEGYGIEINGDSLVGLLRTMCAVRLIQSYHEFRKRNRFSGFMTDWEYRRCAANSLHWLTHQPLEALA
jgi:hypothetical protein